MSDLLVFRKTEHDDFTRNYCDYDMSLNNTQESTYGEQLIPDEDEDAKNFRDKWDDKAHAPYYTSYETKNAQTVSYKQRHRPVFQLFIDFNFAILVTAGLILGYILNLQEEEITRTQLSDKLLPRLLYASIYFGKFF